MFGLFKRKPKPAQQPLQHPLAVNAAELHNRMKTARDHPHNGHFLKFALSNIHELPTQFDVRIDSVDAENPGEYGDNGVYTGTLSMPSLRKFKYKLLPSVNVLLLYRRDLHEHYKTDAIFHTQAFRIRKIVYSSDHLPSTNSAGGARKTFDKVDKVDKVKSYNKV